VIKEVGFYVYNMYNIEEHFSISITPVRSPGGSLVNYNGVRDARKCLALPRKQNVAIEMRVS
jgi:hypothetical protein